MQSDWPPPAASGLEADRREALFFRRPRRTRRHAVNVTGRDESGELPGQVVAKSAGRIRQGQDRLATRLVAVGSSEGGSSASPRDGGCTKRSRKKRSHPHSPTSRVVTADV